MNYGRLIVHEGLEMSICPGDFEAYLNKSAPNKPINWLNQSLSKSPPGIREETWRFYLYQQNTVFCDNKVRHRTTH
jgi:hypothetical protein